LATTSDQHVNGASSSRTTRTSLVTPRAGNNTRNRLPPRAVPLDRPDSERSALDLWLSLADGHAEPHRVFV